MTAAAAPRPAAAAAGSPPPYFAPKTLDDAVAVLAREPDRVAVAGATDVLPAIRTGGRAMPERWLALHDVAGLAAIEAAPGGLRLGAGVTHAALEGDPRVRAAAPAIADAAALMGAPATRAVATLGGNVANGSPAMDLGAPLLVHDAEVEIAGPAGRRTAPLAALLAAPGRVELRRGDLLAAFTLASGPSAYVRHGYRDAMEVTIAGAAARIALAAGEVRDVRIALSAVAPVCTRVPAAEHLLRHRPPTPDALAAAAGAAADAADPIDDLRAPADYRRAVAAVVVRRALDAALARAREAPET